MTTSKSVFRAIWAGWVLLSSLSASAQPAFVVTGQTRTVSASMRCNCGPLSSESLSAPDAGPWEATATALAQNCPPPGGGGSTSATQQSNVGVNFLAGWISRNTSYDVGCNGGCAATCSITFEIEEPQPFSLTAEAAQATHISLTGVVDQVFSGNLAVHTGTLKPGSYTFTFDPLDAFGGPYLHTYQLVIGDPVPAEVVAGPFFRPGDTVRTYYQLGASTWEEADAGARMLGGNLVTTTSADEHTWLMSTFASVGPAHKWIGFNSLENPNTTTFRWRSGNGLTYTRWGPIGPFAGFGNYVYAADAHLWAQSPNIPSIGPTGGIVEVVDPHALPPTVAGPLCIDGSGRKYYVLAPCTYFDAEEKAALLGGHLVTLNDATEHAILHSVFRDEGTPEKWIGLTSLPIRGNQNFRWLSAQALSYTNWAPGFPVAGGGNFVYMRSDGRWAQATDGATSLARGAIIEVTPCPCDWNADSDVTSVDFFAFVSDFFTGGADFDCSGQTTSQDFFDFLACFLGVECP